MVKNDNDKTAIIAFILNPPVEQRLIFGETGTDCQSQVLARARRAAGTNMTSAGRLSVCRPGMRAESVYPRMVTRPRMACV